MKRGIADFVSKCPNYQQVKVEHKKPGGMTQEIDIPTWKWDVINMDFITGLPRIRRQHDSIWVIVDRMTKSSRFLAVKTTHSAKVFSLALISGSHFRKVLVLKLTLVQHFIHRRMGRQGVPFRP